MSQDKHISEEIDGHCYQVLMMNPLDAADMLADLGYIMAPAMGALGGAVMTAPDDGTGFLSGLFEDEGDGDKNDEGANEDGVAFVEHAEAPKPREANPLLGDAIERAVLGFFERANKVKQREFIKKMAKLTTVITPGAEKHPNLAGVMSIHFRGRTKSMYLWFFYAMKVQFADFFTGQGGAMSAALDRVANKMGG